MKIGAIKIQMIWFSVFVGLTGMFVGSDQALAAAGVAGKVTDFSTGRLISNAALSTVGATAHTAADGSYTLSLSSGVYNITVAKTGYQEITFSNVLVLPNTMTDLDVRLTTPGVLNISTPTLPAVEVGVDYNTSIRLSGGVWPYVFDLQSGSLPAGLALDTEYGNIHGSATQAGSHTFVVGVTDGMGGHAERSFTIEISEPLRITTPSPLPRGTRSQTYFNTMEASGGTLPYHFALLDGSSIPPGLALSFEGVLSGTPTQTGSYLFTVQVTDDSNRTAKTTFQVTIDDPLLITTNRLRDGIMGLPYNQTLSASGGQGRLTWSFYAGLLPEGLSLDETSGVLSGTPTENTYGTVVFRVTDEAKRVAYEDLTLSVEEPLDVLTTALPDGLVGELYSEAIRIQGGIAPFSFSFTGQLPAGLNLDTEQGILMGRPESTGLVNLRITVTDSTYPTTQSVIRDLSVRTLDQLVVMTSALLPKEKKGVASNPLVLVAQGGPSPYTWQVVHGSMPEGMTLNQQTGELSGTPADAGDFQFTIQVTDAEEATAQKTLAQFGFRGRRQWR